MPTSGLTDGQYCGVRLVDVVGALKLRFGERGGVVAAWYVWKETGPAGPLSNQDLARSIKAEEIGPDDWLWHDRLGEWTVAGTIDFLWSRSQRTVPGEARDDIPRAEQTQGVTPIVRTPSGAVETPSLTALYLRRLKSQRNQETADVEAGAMAFVDDLVAASVDGPDDIRAVTDHNASREAAVYLRQVAPGERENAKPSGGPPPLPASATVRPPPLPSH